MKFLRILVFLPFLFLISCNHRKATTTAELIDTSLSISPRAEDAALNAVRDQIKQMDRGDILILIPVAGNARNDAGGRILRLEAPSIRQAYDADLRKFQKRAERQFTTWATADDTDRFHTDLLGSLSVARQALASSPKRNALRLVVVSDFIEDDGEFRFASDSSLTNATHGRALALRLRAARGLSVQGVTVCLGRLESLDFQALTPERQEAIDVFWETYLAGNDRTPEIEIDGLGMLRSAHTPCLANPDSSDRLEEGRR